MTGPLATKETLPPLLCLHAAGATSAMFATIGEKLGAEADITAVDLPGRGSVFDQPFLTRMGEAVDHIHPLLAEATDRNYAIFGYSMGALIGFALTQHLHDTGGPLPAVLIVAAARAPHVPAREADLHQLDDTALLGELTRFAGTLPELLADAELMALVLPRLRSDLELCETYRVRTAQPVPVPIHAFGGASDEKITLDDLSAWMDLSTEPGTAQHLQGGHFFIDDDTDRFAARVSAILHATFGRPIARTGNRQHG